MNRPLGSIFREVFLLLDKWEIVMAGGYIHWDKLDNTANIFPVIAGENMTNTYRISCVLKEEVDKVRNRMNEISSWGDAEHNANRKRIVEAVDKVLFKMSQR